MLCQDTGQARREAGPDDQVTTLGTGESIETEQTLNVIERIARWHHVRTRFEGSTRIRDVIRGSGKQHCVRTDRPPRCGTQFTSRSTKRTHDRGDVIATGIAQNEVINADNGKQLASCTCPNDATPMNKDPHECDKRSAKVGAGQLTPPAMLRRDATRAAKTERRSHQTGDS
jgi:hypothetical protein